MECRTPPYPRAARAARAARAPLSSQGEECGVDDEPLSTLAARQGRHPTHPIPVHIGAYPPPSPSMMPHPFQGGMMLNVHLGHPMSSNTSVPPEAWTGSRHEGHALSRFLCYKKWNYLKMFVINDKR